MSSVVAGHHVRERLPRGEPLELLADEPVGPRLHRAAVAADVRREQQVGRRPQRVVRPAAARGRPRRGPRGSGSLCSSASSASVSTTGPREMLTSSAPSFIRPSISASKSPVVSSVPGTISTTTSASGSRSGSSSIACTPSRALPRDPDDLGLERQDPCLDRLADLAVADDQHLLVGQRLARLRRATRLAPGPGRTPGCRAGSPGSAPAVSSAVEVSWMPRPLHSSTPSGT